MIKSCRHRFLRAQGQSTNITIRNLRLSMEQQWGSYPRNEIDAAGIELGQVNSVRISNIDMHFLARADHYGAVGICIPIDIGTHDVEIRNVTCKGAWGGALIALGTIGNLVATSAESVDTVSNINVSNLTFDGAVATGFKSGWMNSTMTNITWDGVTVINGDAASASLCWMRTHSFTAYYPLCVQQLVSKVTDVWFKRFRGKVGGVPSGGEWNGVNNMTVTEYHFEDWQSSAVV